MFEDIVDKTESILAKPIPGKPIFEIEGRYYNIVPNDTGISGAHAIEINIEEAQY
jgi:hypothetical protein